MEEASRKYGSAIMPGSELEKSEVFVPLIAGDQARGVITLLDMEHEHAFSESDVRLLQTLANSMSVALENARLFDETQRRTRESAALAEVGRDISSTLDVSKVMDRIAQHAKDLLNVDTSAIFLPNDDGANYRAIVAVGDIAEALRETEIEFGVGIIGGLVESGRAEYINDTNADPRGIQITGTDKEENERLMVAPLLAGRTGQGRDGGVADGRRAVQRQRPRLPGRAVAAGHRGHRECAAVRRVGEARDGARNHQHGVAAARRASSSWPRCSTWSASRFARCSAPTWPTSRCTTPTPASSTSRTSTATRSSRSSSATV